MATYRAFVTRKITTTQHCVVMVKSSNETYARQDAIASAKDWEDDGVVRDASEIEYISEVK